MFPPDVHKPLSGSRLSRVIECPGSFKLAQTFENKQSSYAAEGTMLHHVVEWYLNNNPIEALDVLLEPKVPSTFQDPSGETFELTREHIRAVEDCLIYLGNVIKTCGPNWSIAVELETSMAKYHTCLFESGGTADIVLVDSDSQVLHIIDWKFGQGVMVSAQNNDQLRSYGVGAMLHFGYLNVTDLDWVLETHVVQPRIDNYDHEVLDQRDINVWLKSRVIPAVTEAYSDNPSFNPGKDQCRWCPAKYTCKARSNYANQTAADIFRAASALPEAISVEEVSEILTRAPAYEDYISDLRVFMQRHLEAGNEDSNWKMVHGRSIRKWADADEAEEFLLEQADVDIADIYTTKLISPSQAEQLSRALRQDEEFNALIVKPDGKPTMVKTSDKRKGIEYMSAIDKFKEALSDNERDL